MSNLQMSCFVGSQNEVNNNEVIKSIQVDCGNNVAKFTDIKYKILSKNEDGVYDFNDEFVERYTSEFGKEPSLSSTGDELNRLKDFIYQYCYQKEFNPIATTTFKAKNTFEPNYVTPSAREQGKKHIANIVKKLYANMTIEFPITKPELAAKCDLDRGYIVAERLVNAKTDLTKEEKTNIINKLKVAKDVAELKAILKENNISFSLNLNAGNLQYYFRKAKAVFINDLAKKIAINTGENKQEIIKRLEAGNYEYAREGLGGNYISTEDKNQLATYYEFISDFDTYKKEVSKHQELQHITFINDESEMIDENNAKEGNSVENGNETKDEGSSVATDESYNTVIAGYEHSGLFTSAMVHVDVPIRLYLSSLPKLKSDAKENGQFIDFDTANELGVPDTMDANLACTLLYHYGNYTSIRDMIDSIRNMANQIPEAGAFYKLADDLDNNDDLAIRFFNIFGKMIISKMRISVVENKSTIDIANKLSNKEYCLISEYLNSLKFTALNNDENFNTTALMAVSSSLEAVRNELGVEKSKIKEKLLSNLYEILRRYYPTITANTLENFVNSNGNVYENLQFIIKKLDDTIKGTRKTLEKYDKREDDIAKARSHNAALNTLAYKGQYVNKDDYEDLGKLYAEDYVSDEQREAAIELAKALQHFSLINVELNSNNVEKHQVSDVINSSLLTNMIQILQSEVALKHFGENKARSLQYKFSNILYEHVDKVTGETIWGLFKQNENGDIVPTSYAKDLLQITLYDGIINEDNGKNSTYPKLGGSDYLANQLIAFFKAPVGVNKIKMGHYFMRTPSDAPKNFLVTAPRYSAEGLFKLINGKELNENAINDIKTSIDIYHYDGSKLANDGNIINIGNVNELAGIIAGKIKHIKLPPDFEMSYLVEKIKKGDTITLKYSYVSKDENGNFNSTVYYLQGTYDGDELTNISFKGFDKQTDIDNILSDTRNSHYQNIYEALKNEFYKNYKSKEKYSVNRKHILVQGLKRIFKQEILDAANAVNMLFVTHDNGLVRRYDSKVDTIPDDFKEGDIMWKETQTKDGRKKKGCYENYHFKTNDDGVGVIVEKDKDGNEVLVGRVFHSDKFRVWNEEKQDYDNLGDELFNKVFNILYGGSDNSFIKVNKNLSTNTIEDIDIRDIEEQVEDMLVEYVQRYVENELKRVEDTCGLIDVDPTRENIADFLLNYQIAYNNFDDLFEGSSKFYKSAQDFLKRAKEGQGSGVPNGIRDWNQSFVINSRTRQEVKNRQLAKLFTDIGLEEDKHVKMYNSFRGVTVKNTIKTNSEALQTIVKHLEEVGLSEDDAKLLMYGKIDDKGTPIKNDSGRGSKKRSGGYQDVTTNDAQSYITLDEWTRRIAARGELAEYADLIKKLYSGEELTIDDLKAFVQVQKNFYFNQHFDESGKLFAPTQIKNAEFVLVPQFIKGTELEYVAKIMKKYGIDQLNTEETSKAGKTGVLEIFDAKTGKVKQDIIDEIDDTEGKIKSEFGQNAEGCTQYFDYRFLYTQQETPQHMNSKNKAAIQIMKKLMDNIPEYLPDGTKHPLYEKKQLYFDIIVQNVQESFTELLQTCGAEVDKDGNLVLETNDLGDTEIKGLDKKLFYSKIQDELLRLGVDANALDYTTTIGNTDIPIMPSFMTMFATKFENVAQSVVTNNVTRQKLPGFHAAQITNIGLTAVSKNITTPYVLKKDESQRITREAYQKLSDKEKKAYRDTRVSYDKDLHYHTDGNGNYRDYIEIKISASAFGFKLKNPDGTLKPKGKIEADGKPTPGSLLEELYNANLQDVIGYRIPTEGKQSIAKMRVVGFIDDGCGSTIVVPDDWVAQTGSDFDVDSVYGINFSTYIDRNGHIQKVGYKESYDEFDWFNYIRKESKENGYSLDFDAIKEEAKTETKDELKTAKEELNKEEKEAWNSLDDGTKNSIRQLHALMKKTLPEKNKDNFIAQLNDEIVLLKTRLEKYKNDYTAEELEAIETFMAIRQEILQSMDNSQKYSEIKSEKINEKLEKFRNARLKYYKQLAKKHKLQSLDSFIATKNADVVKSNSREARTNKLIEIMMEVLSHDTQIEENYSRSNFDDIKDALKAMMPPALKRKREGRSAYNPIDQADYQNEVMSGAKLKAFSVTRDTFLSVCNTVKPTLAKSQALKVKYSTKVLSEKDAIARFGKDNVEPAGKGYIYVTHNQFGWNNENRNVIGKLLLPYSSQTTAHMLDAVKMGAIPNVNDFTFGVYKTFPDLGIDYETCLAFMLQHGVTRISDAYFASESALINYSAKPLNAVIRDIAKDLGLNVKASDTMFSLISKIAEKYNDKFKELYGEDAVISLEADDIAKLIFDKEFLKDKLDNYDKYDKETQALIDLGTFLQFKRLYDLSNKITDIARVCNPDKFGAKQSLYEADLVFQTVKDLANDNTFMVGDKNILESIYPNLIITGTEMHPVFDKYGFGVTDENGELVTEQVEVKIVDMDAFLSSPVGESAYKPLCAYLKYSTCASLKINNGLFETRDSQFLDKIIQLKGVLPNGKRVSKELHEAYKQFMIRYLYNNCHAVLTPMRMEDGQFIPLLTPDILNANLTPEQATLLNERNAAFEEERRRIFGYGYSMNPTMIQQEERVVNNNPADYSLHSGGASGSDFLWGHIGEQYGVQINHYYNGERSEFNAPYGNVKISQEDYQEGAKEAARAARRNFGYSLNTVSDDRLIRNWNQVKYSDAIFAIGHIARVGDVLFPDSPREQARAKVIPENPLQKSSKIFTREQVARDARTLYIFTDNTDRTSGTSPIDEHSWYAKKYGNGKQLAYPNSTTAAIRGLNNARPISTVKWFYKLHDSAHPKTDRTSTALWHDSDFEEFKQVIDAEFEDIFEAWKSGTYDRIMFPQGDGLFNAEISNITKERTPKIYNYLQQKLQELKTLTETTTFDKRRRALAETVQGGTGYAVSMAINNNKPVYVFDVNDKHWYHYENGKFVVCEPPVLTPRFGGIGTRGAESGKKREVAEKAIKDIYERTFGKVSDVKSVQEKQDEISNANIKSSADLNNVPEEDSGRFAGVAESKKTLESKRTILSNEELAHWNAKGITNPRILVASERTDPAFHVNEILDIIDGKTSIPKFGFVNGKRVKVGEITKDDINGLYLITKHDGLPMRKLLETKIPKLIHFSVTSLGGTVYEPGVMKYNDLLDRIEEYIKLGLEPDSVTIRIDPIVPGITKIEDVETIIKRASEMGITRIKFSVMDGYGNTKEHMQKLSYDFSKYYDKGPTGVFHARQDVLDGIATKMIAFAQKYGVKLSTCAEPLVKAGISKEGCLSVSAVNKMLGTQIEDKGEQNNTSRKLCTCFGGKIDALQYNNSCASHCVYCYAKHDKDEPHKYYNPDGSLIEDEYTQVEKGKSVGQNNSTITINHEVPFTIADVTNPTNDEVYNFQKLTPAQKVTFIKQYLPSGTVFDHVSVNLSNTGRLNRGQQTIHFAQGMQNIENIRLQFAQAFNNTNPLIALTTLDIVKYSFLVEGYKMQKRGVSNMIPNSVLYEDVNQGGTNIVGELRKTMSDVNSTIDDETNQYLMECFARSVSNPLGLPQKTVTYFKKAKEYELSTTGDVIILDKTNDYELSLAKKYNLVDDNNYVNSYVKLKFGYKGDLNTYKVTEKNGIIYAYPLNPLEDGEQSDFSANPNYHKLPTAAYYEVIIAGIEDAQRNNAIFDIKSINKEDYMADITPINKELAPIDLNFENPSDTTIGLVDFIKDECDKKLSDETKPGFILYSQNLKKYIKSDGKTYGLLNKKVIINGKEEFVDIYRVPDVVVEKQIMPYLNPENKTKPIKQAYDEFVQGLNSIGIIAPTSTFEKDCYVVERHPYRSSSIRETRSSGIRESKNDRVRNTFYDSINRRKNMMFKDIHAQELATRWRLRGVENTTANEAEIIKNYGQYLRKHVDDLTNKLKYFMISDASGAYLPITHLEVISKIKVNDAKNREFLEVINDVDGLLRELEFLNNISITSDDPLVESAYKQIQDIVNELSRNTLVEEAKQLYAEEYLVSKSTDPRLKNDLLQIFDYFYKTASLTSQIFDLQESEHPLVQLTTKIVTNDISAKDLLARKKADEWDEWFAGISRQAAADGKSINFDNIIDEKGDWITDYDDTLKQEFDDFKDAINSAKADVTAATNHVERNKAMINYLKVKHDFDLWKIEHINQELIDDYYKVQAMNDHYMLYGEKLDLPITIGWKKHTEHAVYHLKKTNEDGSTSIKVVNDTWSEWASIDALYKRGDFNYNGYTISIATPEKHQIYNVYTEQIFDRRTPATEIFAEYKWLEMQKWEVYGDIRKLGATDELLARLKEINKKIGDLTETGVYNPLTGITEDKKSLSEIELSDDPDTALLQKIESREQANMLQGYQGRKRRLEEEVYEKQDEFGFKEELERNQHIVKSYEKRDGNGNITVPMNLLLENEEYVKAKRWIQENARFVRSDAFVTEINEAFRKLKGDSTEDRSKELKHWVRERNAKDNRGVIDGRKLEERDLALIKDEVERKYYHERAARGSDRVLINSCKKSNKIYKEAFYRHLTTDDRINYDYYTVVSEINDILKDYYDESTQTIHFERIPNNEEGLAIYTKLNELYSKLKAIEKHPNATKEDKIRVANFIENEVNTTLTDEEQAVFDSQELAAQEKGDEYYRHWCEVNYTIKEIYDDATGEVIGYEREPNPYIYHSLTPIDEDGWLDVERTQALKTIDENYETVPTEYYYMAIEEAKAAGNYKDWYYKNHVYNPYTCKYEPLPCWTTLSYKDIDSTTDTRGEWVPRSNYQHKTPRTKYKNNDFKENVGTLLNYKKGTGRDNSKLQEANEYELAVKKRMQEIFEEEAKDNPVAKDFFRKGHLVYQRKNDEEHNAAFWGRQALDFFGLRTKETGDKEFYDKVDYNLDKTKSMPMVHLLDQKKRPIELRRPRQEEGESNEAYQARLQEYKDAVAKLNKENEEAHAAAIDRDWAKVVHNFIIEAGHFNAIAENKPLLFYTLNQLHNVQAYKQKHGIYGDFVQRSETDTRLRTVEDTNILPQYENWIRRLMYNQYKQNNGTLTKWANRLQGLTSSQYMMMNIRGGFANINVGRIQIWAEAAAGDVVDPKAFNKACWEYSTSIRSMFAYCHSDKSSSVVDAIIKYFHVVDFDELAGKCVVVESPSVKAVDRLNHALYFPLTGGEHMMQNEALLAVLMSHRLYEETTTDPTTGESITKLVFKNLKEVQRDCAETALLSLLTEEEKEQYKKYKEGIRKNKNLAKEFVWFRREEVSEFAKLLFQNDKDRKRKFVEALEKEQKYQEELFNNDEAHPTIFSQLELGDNKKLAFKRGSLLEKYDDKSLEVNKDKDVTNAYELLGSIRNRTISLNHKIHGVYDKLGQAQIENNWWGSLAMQYHKHLPMGFFKNFRRHGYYNEERGTVEKGAYVSAWDFLSYPFRKKKFLLQLSEADVETFEGMQNILKEIWKGACHLSLNYKMLPEYDKANIRRVFRQMAGVLAGMLGILILKGADDDKEDKIWWNLALYEMDRLTTESSQFSPRGMFREFKTLWSTPVAAESFPSDVLMTIKLIKSYFFDDDFSAEFKSGRYAGRNKFGVYLERRTPIWRGIKTGILDIKTSNRYYKVGSKPINSELFKDMSEYVDDNIHW